MKATVQYLMEPLLTQFFLIDSICKDHLRENERLAIFRELANIFCVPLDEETEAFYALANDAIYREVADQPAYERLCRTLEYAASTGQAVGLTTADRMILSQKREAMQIKSRLFRQSKHLSRDMIAGTLLDTALSGNVDAMATLAYLEYHGICVCRDPETALSRLRLCGGWNHLFGLLMAACYDGENRQDHYDTLCSLLRSAQQKQVFAHICQVNGFAGDCRQKPEIRIVEKAFGMGILQRHTYDPGFAKVAFSQLLSAEDKEKLLLSKKKDAIASLTEIPFDARRQKAPVFSKAAAAALPLQRQPELDKLLCSLWPAFHGKEEMYRPLLVASSDDYLSEMYVQALQKGLGQEGKLMEVDAGNLTLRDLTGDREHFILRGLSETKNSHTVFAIKHCEALQEPQLQELLKLLDYSYRRKFKLVEPVVSMDLSDVVLVLFASEMSDGVRQLSAACDTVYTQRVSEEEKQTVIENAFRTRRERFGVEEMTLAPEGKSYLSGFGTEQILRMIDDAMKKAAYQEETVITEEILKTVSQQQLSATRREFGYLGGKYHETY